MEKILKKQIRLAVESIAILVGLIAFFLTVGLGLIVAPANNPVEYPFQVLMGGAAGLMVLGLAEQTVREYFTLRHLLKQARGKRV